MMVMYKVQASWASPAYCVQWEAIQDQIMISSFTSIADQIHVISRKDKLYGGQAVRWIIGNSVCWKHSMGRFRDIYNSHFGNDFVTSKIKVSIYEYLFTI